jgi:hypothetical protein
MDDKNIKNVVVRLEVFTVVKMLMVVLWVVMLCGLADWYIAPVTFRAEDVDGVFLQDVGFSDLHVVFLCSGV